MDANGQQARGRIVMEELEHDGPVDDPQLIAHKVRVHLNNKQSAWMRHNCVACRLAYNFAVAKLRDSKKEDGERFPSAFSVSKQWTQERDERHPWMLERGLNMDTISGVFATRYAAALNQWKLSGWSPDKVPVFHGRREKLRSTWRGRLIKQTGPRTFTLPGKQGSIRIGDDLRFDGEIRSVTFSFNAGKWYASFLIKAVVPRPSPAPSGTAVGVDVGVAQFASLSNGKQYPPAQDYQRELDKLAKLQRQAARMQGPIKNTRKASHNWRKHQAKIAKQHARISNKRRHYSEFVTKKIATQFNVVAIEDLKVKNMTASAKGDAENPGSKVAQKSGLNRSVLNGGFFQFRSRLEAKVSARAGSVIAVNPAYTSQTCAACGHVARENRLDQATFRCVECGHEANADVNAAQNILTRAIAGA